MTDPGAPRLRIRQAVRALLVTPDHEVLLARFEFSDRTVWALPGGGVEPGEDHITALHRELIEEVGLADAVIGAHVWSREHIIPFEDGQWDGQQDRVYVVEAQSRFDPAPGFTWEQLRAERLHELRWWHLDDVESMDESMHEMPHDRVLFAPRRLGALLRQLVTDGPPATPIDTGV